MLERRLRAGQQFPNDSSLITPSALRFPEGYRRRLPDQSPVSDGQKLALMSGIFDILAHAMLLRGECD
jgi:hypothetical protein